MPVDHRSRTRRLAFSAVGVAAALGVAIAWFAGRPVGPAKRLALARRLVLAGRPDAALAEARRALASLDDRGDPALRLKALAATAQIADFHLSRAYLPEALRYYQQIVRLGPGTAAAYHAGVRIAQILHERMHDDVHAEAQYLAVVDAFPHRPGIDRLVLQAAEIALDSRRTEAARADAARLVAQYPTSPRAPDAQIIVGQSFELEGRLQDATKAFSAVGERWPGTPAAARALYQKGTCLADQGDYGDAIASYIQALPTYPDPIVVQQSLARARRHFTAEIAIQPGSHAYAFAR